jgi:hypothetical protein
VWSVLRWLNIYEQRRSYVNMKMSFVPHKDEELLGQVSDSQFINKHHGTLISSVIMILLSETDISPPIIYIQLKKG